MKHFEEKVMAATTVLAASLIAAHSFSAGGFTTLFGTYAYWLVRISMQSLMFFSARLIIVKYAPKPLSGLTVLVGSILLSLVPYVLSVTAMDIVLGYPELGLASDDRGTPSRVLLFALEVLFLFDNHVVLCLLLSIPGWIQGVTIGSTSIDNAGAKDTFLSAIDPPIVGEILWVEAQEHYVRITTTIESRMVLARFSDIVRELPLALGLQVHRSHWVAKSAILETKKNGQNLSVILTTGASIPVSRSFRTKLMTEIEALE